MLVFGSAESGLSKVYYRHLFQYLLMYFDGEIILDSERTEKYNGFTKCFVSLKTLFLKLNSDGALIKTFVD